MRHTFHSFIVLVILTSGLRVNGQTLFIPSGINGINASTNSNVGIGTPDPQVKLHIKTVNMDNIGLVIHSYSINHDSQQHYSGLAFDGDYGNGTGNCSQIRSYSNLYSRWGSTLTFHTTAAGIANSLVERMRIDQDGNVGIGTVAPLDKFDVYGKFLVNNDGIIDWGGYRSYGRMTWDDGRAIIGGQANMALVLTANNSEKVRIDINGNVGIGTSNSGDYKLNVSGKIRANEIVVNTTGADFVFEPSYKLRPLSEVETFIKTNKHLPDIDTAKEMQENGVSAGEMQAKLLQKVEELTLYVIELKKENVEQQKKITELQEKININEN